MRGLKYVLEIVAQVRLRVAPYTGAWIEIFESHFSFCKKIVAPYTGAWIEIGLLPTSITLMPVAPYTGAWIEINCWKSSNKFLKASHPTRVRGLKFTN